MNFYALPQEQQVERYAVLAKEAVRQWDLENVAIDLLNIRENAVFKLTAQDGSAYVLRIHRHQYHTDDELASELQWMQALNEYGVRTPDIIPTREGNLFCIAAVNGVPEPRQCDMLEWVEGRMFGSGEGEIDGSIESQEENYRFLGELAGRTHNHAEQWNPPRGFTRHHWDVEGLVGETPFWGRFWELEALTREQRKIILSVRELVRRKLIFFGQAPDRYGLIHADLLPQNLLISGDGIRLIDFDDAGFGWHLFDLSTSLFSYLGGNHFTRMQNALVAGYRKVRSLPESHLAMMPVFIMARLLTYLGWVHTRYETETAQTMTPLVVEGACGYAETLMTNQ